MRLYALTLTSLIISALMEIMTNLQWLSLQDEDYGYHVKSALRNSDILLLFWEHIISLFENSDTIDVDM